MVHTVPENFNISDFDVFHSALLSTQIIYSKSVELDQHLWNLTQNMWCLAQTPHILSQTPQMLVKFHRCWSNSTDFEWMIWAESGVIVQTRFCGEWNLEFGSNTKEKFEISRGEAK